MPREPELVAPDPRWENMVGDRDELASIANSWPNSPTTPNDVARMLEVARHLWVYSYFVWEFGTVAVVWAALALEAGLRECFELETRDQTSVRSLIKRARDARLLDEDQGVRLDALAQFRNRLVHRKGQVALTLGMSAPALEVAHEAIASLFGRPQAQTD